MIVPLHSADTPSTNRQPYFEANRPVADTVVQLRIAPRDVRDRKLRNRIILANATIWIVILSVLGILLL